MSVPVTPQFSRFAEEVARLADQHECSVAELLKGIISPAQYRAMEHGLGEMDKLLTRDMRWVYLLSLGVDLKYVMFGERASTLTQ